MDRCAAVRRIVLEFIERLELFDSVDGVTEALAVLLAAHSIEHFLLSFLPAELSTVADVLLIDHLPAGMVQNYIEKNYLQIDPTLRRCRTSVRPFRTFDMLSDPKADVRVAGILHDALDFGAGDGIMVPVSSAKGRLGQIFFAGRKIVMSECELTAVHFASLYAFDRILRIKGLPLEPQPRLTPREREALLLMGLGKSRDEIGEAMHISARTVAAHIEHSCVKLGATNSTQALMIAVRDRIIQP